MTKRMLIDATHDEETRVAIVDEGRLLEFDYESKYRKPLKGNIFLAKVTRVEPSLQAAFVNYGGNRHGFLPFSEIHPDYFRIPIADREALMAEQEEAIAQAEAHEAAEEIHDQNAEMAEQDGGSSAEIEPEPIHIASDNVRQADDEPADPFEVAGTDIADSEDDLDGNTVSGAEGEEDDHRDDGHASHPESGEDTGEETENGHGSGEQDSNGQRRSGRHDRHRRGGSGKKRFPHKNRSTERFDDMDEEERFRFNLRRRYKIQEVIKRGQIMLVQVSKEERGNKGAAVSSYLSLPGRYCVLMPNSPRAGGVSRKIANYKDRNRMREIIRELEVPKGMSVILRTAGVERTKAEIKRDLDYLIRLWNDIRDLTLQSSAPSLVYEEADLIKRAVRDLYTGDVEEIHVAGAEGFKTAKGFMKLLMPSHVKRIHEHTDAHVPLFSRYKAEDQIVEIGEPQVRLPSGGYLVINPTEALVSVDVNSGKATKERHIEETALRTNLEAAEEVARQLRLRDLGGLIVIDFIDMEDRRNNARVERRMRDALSTDRARIQMGRISSFGLMELSRQRMNPSLTEAQFGLCKHCKGVGRIRTADALSIIVLRAIEEEGLRARAAQVIAHVTSEVALYILNHKRRNLAEIEARHTLQVLIRVDDEIMGSDYRVEVSRPVKNNEDEEETQEDRVRASAPVEEEERDHGRVRPAERGDQERGDSDRTAGRRRGRRGGRRRNGRDEGDQNPNPRSDSDMSNSDEDFSPAPELVPYAAAEEPKNSPPAADEQDTAPPVRARRGGRPPSVPKPSVEASPVEETASQKSPDKESAPGPTAPKRRAVRASNAPDKAAPARDYETVNKPPENKKKGWWSR